MCTIAVKYFDHVGWVGAKNRDRNYETTVNIVRSRKYGVERMMIDDETTRWTEGLNEYGVCILSSALSVKMDEKETEVVGDRPSRRGQPGYYAPDGRKIRKALLEKTPKAAAELLQKLELSGATVVYNTKECYILEGGFTEKKTTNRNREYISVLKEVSRDVGVIVRTNHGIYIKELGYMKGSDDPKIQRSRESSESRYRIALKNVQRTVDPENMMDALSKSESKDPFMNPIRYGDVRKKDLVTTGQIMVFPYEQTLHYRPIQSTVKISFHKVNSEDSKTFAEVITNRKLLSFKDFKNTK